MNFNTILLFALIIMCAYFIEGLIGFGGTVIAIPVASMVLDLKVTISVLTIVVLLASLIIAVRDFKYIDKKQYIKIISIMIFGLPIGIWLFASLPEKPLKVALGLFMIYMSVKGIYNSTEKRKAALAKLEDKPRSKGGNIIDSILIFLGGIVHGAFSCGGPLVVVYATKNIKDKTSFRATLCALWSTLNAIMLSVKIYRGEVNLDIVKISGITMIFVIIAIILSNIVHKKIKGDSFSLFVYIALGVAGILMII